MNNATSPRGVLLNLLHKPISESAICTWDLPDGSSNLDAIMYGLISRAVKGEASAVKSVFEIIDPVSTLSDEKIDALSAALEEFIKTSEIIE